MALTESDIKIIIAAELKKAGFDKAQKATTSLEKSFKRLGKTATRTFVAVAGIRALKQAVIGFAEQEKAAVRLEQSLRNLGLAYNTKAIADYLEQTEKATGINKDQLTPAIQGLINTTLSAEKSIKMLGLAMDISASTGKDLGSVTNALSRAYTGNFAALGKIQTAYTSAELKALGFNGALEVLADNYGGAASRNADTYAGKIDKLAIAFGDMRDEIGKGIVAFLESLGTGDYDNGLQKLVNFGTAIGDAFRRAGVTIEYTKALLSTGFRIDEEEMRKLEEIRSRFEKPQAAANRAANNPAANRAFLADLRKQQQLNKKIEADRKKAAALAAKAEQERLKKEREALQLKRAGTIFDMENIQIVAALQGQIDGEQRLRLVALLAINNDIADAAEKAATAVMAINAPALANLGVMVKAGDTIQDVIAKLVVSQAKVALIDLGITNLPKAKNPFDAWDEILKNIISQLDTIAAKIKGMPVLGAPTGTTTTTTTPSGTSTTTTTVGGGTGGTGGGTTVTNPSVSNLGKRVGDTLDTLDLLNLYGNGASSGNIGSNPAITNLGKRVGDILDTTDAALFTILASSSVSGGANPALTNLMKRTGDYSVDSTPSVTVVVQGSVIAQQDLTEIITDELYQYQKAGKSILYDSVSI